VFRAAISASLLYEKRLNTDSSNLDRNLAELGAAF